MHTHEAIIKAVETTMPAVVSVIASHALKSTKNAADLQDGGGSGFLVLPFGTVLTNRHVLDDPNADYTVVTGDGEELPATILARDPINDIGILAVPLENHPVITLGDSRALQLGQTVIAIGNALGQFRDTVSVGVVSGLSRSVVAGFSATDTSNTQNLRGLIQTDAAINPGNSGGPLIDLDGRAIGVNAAVLVGAQNISFAIPIHNALRDVDHLQRFGRLRIPYLGVRYVTLTPENAKKLNAPLTHGALVVKERGPEAHAVAPGSPAEKAGLREGDVILSCAGETISERRALLDIVQDHEAGDQLSCNIWRDGKTVTAALIPAERA